MAKAKVFKSGNSQAVRLPKAFRFSDDMKEVRIRRHGKGVLLEPIEDADPWAPMLKVIGTFSDDLFEDGRDQPAMPPDRDLDW